MLDRVFVIEIVALYWPIVASMILVQFVTPRIRVGVLLALVWQLACLPWINYLAQLRGWWSFAETEHALLGMPLSLYIGWVVLWGGLGVMALRWFSVLSVLVAALILDLVAMPLMSPVVVLHSSWLLGEAVCLCLGLVPGLLLAKWSVHKQRPEMRSFLICTAFAVLVITILPVVSESLETLQERWNSLGSWWYLLVFTVFILGLPSVAAACQFARLGRGTPIPFDPPQRLITSGVYAYMRNPMQTSMVCVLLVLGVVFQSYLVASLAVLGVVYSCGLARWSEGLDLKNRYGRAWFNYEKNVGSWKPALRPYTGEGVAKIYFDADCTACCSIAQWFYRRDPRGIELARASDYPGAPLKRVTYRYAKYGVETKGVHAIACALEHIHLGWAIVAWCIQLPLILPLIQLCMDLAGGGKKE